MSYEKFLLDIIGWSASNRPRSLQKRIGPSGLADPCDHCLGHGILQHTRHSEPGGWWLPLLGTGFHSMAEAALEQYNAQVEDRFLIEHRVTVGEIGPGGKRITVSGTLDAYDKATGTVIDWKLVGRRTLSKPPSPTYLGQIELYGLGLMAEGRPVNGTCIMMLPRDERLPFSGKPILRKFDPERPVALIDRADRIARLVLEDPLAVNWLPRLEKCWNCDTWETA